MRLSEAILLGSTVVKPRPGALRFANENSGCALGMAVIAIGGTFVRRERPVRETERRTLNIEDVWGAWLLQRVDRPCNCGAPFVLNRLHRNKLVTRSRYPIFHLPREMRIKDILVHLFDYHVMQSRDWTLDRLTEWLQPFEPHELGTSSTRKPRFDFLDDFTFGDAEWGRTRQAFESQMRSTRTDIPGSAERHDRH